VGEAALDVVARHLTQQCDRRRGAAIVVVGTQVRRRFRSGAVHEVEHLPDRVAHGVDAEDAVTLVATGFGNPDVPDNPPVEVSRTGAEVLSSMSLLPMLRNPTTTAVTRLISSPISTSCGSGPRSRVLS
jgi:hypothetical protein